jgi:hypothetical protein
VVAPMTPDRQMPLCGIIIDATCPVCGGPGRNPQRNGTRTLYRCEDPDCPTAEFATYAPRAADAQKNEAAG